MTIPPADAIEAAGTAVAVGWKHRARLKTAMRKVRRLIRSGRLTILIHGAGGAGKSTVGKFIEGSLTDEELERGYRRSLDIERRKMPGTIAGRALVAPGQSPTNRRPTPHRPMEMQTLLASGQVDRVIDVVADGHHAWDGQDSFAEHVL